MDDGITGTSAVEKWEGEIRVRWTKAYSAPSFSLEIGGLQATREISDARLPTAVRLFNPNLSRRRCGSQETCGDYLDLATRSLFRSPGLTARMVPAIGFRLEKHRD